MDPAKPVTRPRVGIISIHPAPYRNGTFAALQTRGVVDVTVITLFDLDPGHGYWDLEESTYPNTNLGKCYGKF